MGLSSLGVIYNIISAIYDIDVRTRELYDRKRDLSRWSREIGSSQSQMYRLKQGEYGRMRTVNFDGWPQYYSQVFANYVDARNNQMGGGPEGRIIVDGQGQRVPDGLAAPVDFNDPVYKRILGGEAVDMTKEAYATLQSGEIWATREEQEAIYASYLRDIKFLEQDLDQQLEELKAQRQTLVSQREEYTKYIGEGTKVTFRNSYSSG